ncbi:MAG: hypothetical protein A3H02_00780 [Candidatus Niyogibacteria bacterium RIFCSPLOWO2_12_FULL_41_13]|uniref:Helix-turn-helix domain-containing protein n=1 Tax=Candidatus Niyogibacteria bacterium RIFCSPLOWO2_12_FULL_41_13 TaxID=1801726 RepID=A0A1G2F2B8_9BACT|nr:MAG: hypothetical protein A3H02_00780 [Candidatus Niyogibacteria bacterium RIFCSPLOWO2_12_FULL_41_13]
MRLTKKSVKNKDFFSVSELAQLLGISRIAVFKRIKKGQIKAVKIGRFFAIPKEELKIILGVILGNKDKAIIDEAVKKIVKEYGETLRLLGRE